MDSSLASMPFSWYQSSRHLQPYSEILIFQFPGHLLKKGGSGSWFSGPTWHSSSTAEDALEQTTIVSLTARLPLELFLG